MKRCIVKPVSRRHFPYNSVVRTRTLYCNYFHVTTMLGKIVMSCLVNKGSQRNVGTVITPCRARFNGPTDVRVSLAWVNEGGSRVMSGWCTAL